MKVNSSNHVASRFRSLKGCWKDTSGAAMLEFGFVAPIFFFLAVGLIQFGLLKFANHVVDNGMSQMARAGMIGCVDGEVTNQECKSVTMNLRTIRQLISNQTAGFLDACNPERFQVSIYPLSSVDHTGINFGNGGEVVVYEAKYTWPIPFMNQIFSIRAANIVRNEEFGIINRRTADTGGGC